MRSNSAAAAAPPARSQAKETKVITIVLELHMHTCTVGFGGGGWGGGGGGGGLMVETLSVEVFSLLTKTLGIRIGGWIVHYGSVSSQPSGSQCVLNVQKKPFTQTHVPLFC
ncbi:unnamed protein product [Boreogadus saida]